MQEGLEKSLADVPTTSKALLSAERTAFYTTNKVEQDELAYRVREKVGLELRAHPGSKGPDSSPEKKQEYVRFVLKDGVHRNKLDVEREAWLKANCGASDSNKNSPNPKDTHSIFRNLPLTQVFNQTTSPEKSDKKKYKALFNRAIKSVVRDLHQYRLIFGHVVCKLPSCSSLLVSGLVIIPSTKKPEEQ